MWILHFLYSSTLVLCHSEPPRLRLFLRTTLFSDLFCAFFSFCAKSHGFWLTLENRGKYNIDHTFLTTEYFGWLNMRCYRLDCSGHRVPLKTLDYTKAALVRYFFGFVQYFDQSERDFLKCRNVLNILCKVSMLCSFCDRKFSVADSRIKQINQAVNVGFSFSIFRGSFFRFSDKYCWIFQDFFCVH